MILVDVNEFCDILNMRPDEVKDMMISGEIRTVRTDEVMIDFDEIGRLGQVRQVV